MSRRLKQKKRTARHPSGRARSARITSYGIDGQNLSLDRIAELIETDSKIALSKEALVRVKQSRQLVEKLAAGNQPLYGINTGFGVLARQRVPARDLEKLQENLILSHAVGVGDPVPVEIIRLMLLLKAHG